LTLPNFAGNFRLKNLSGSVLDFLRLEPLPSQLDLPIYSASEPVAKLFVI
jgi:hypothetical protein